MGKDDDEEDWSARAQLQKELKRQLSKHKVLDYVNANRPLLGLFIPAPSWPPVPVTLDRFLFIGVPRLAFLTVSVTFFFIGVMLLLSWLRATTALCIFGPPVLYGGFCQVKKRRREREPCQDVSDEDWSEKCQTFWDPGCPGAMQRRRKVAEEILSSVDAKKSPEFNAHVQSTTALAIYGCGILAATHVGGLRALEEHGLQLSKLKTIAGVSAGAVVAAMLAVGCNAEQIFELVQNMEFYKIALPELGAIVRILGTLIQSVLDMTLGSAAADVVECLAGGTGPGINSGTLLEEMIGDALKKHCGDADISMKAVQDRFGKRLVILACELDSGHERRFTPETDPDLPLRVAVRMSMGVPGLMEPLKYRGHMYCDGGMCNDFPMNALPEDEKRIGLMVRPVDWIQHHIPGLQAIIPKDKLEKHPKVMEHLSTLISKKPTLWSVKTIMDLAMTSVNIMMDANLVLQIAAATARKQLPLDGGISELAPEILTLCGGRLDPFDFNLTKDQHRELYLSGQLSTHLHASIVDKTNEVLSDEGKLKTLLYSMHLDYPQMGTPIQR
mmetsp:Transcript_32790/g.78427  ORF Transcript_32790/g.78427 Transcript_32790/m.78427 type:complete len:556 (+) Transcript_32790:45-1712(+)